MQEDELRCLLATSLVRASETDIAKKWFELSKDSQNIGFSLEWAMKTGRPDDIVYKEGIKKIDLALQYLVKQKVLVEKHLIINFSLDGEKATSYSKLEKFASSLSDDYGYFTAMEMCDIGVRSKLAEFGEGDNYTLKVRLPEARMDKFLQLVETLPIYVDTLN